jgi:hypothetical protein
MMRLPPKAVSVPRGARRVRRFGAAAAPAAYTEPQQPGDNLASGFVASGTSTLPYVPATTSPCGTAADVNASNIAGCNQAWDLLRASGLVGQGPDDPSGYSTSVPYLDACLIFATWLASHPTWPQMTTTALQNFMSGFVAPNATLTVGGAYALVSAWYSRLMLSVSPTQLATFDHSQEIMYAPATSRFAATTTSSEMSTFQFMWFLVASQEKFAPSAAGTTVPSPSTVAPAAAPNGSLSLSAKGPAPVYSPTLSPVSRAVSPGSVVAPAKAIATAPAPATPAAPAPAPILSSNYGPGANAAPAAPSAPTGVTPAASTSTAPTAPVLSTNYGPGVNTPSGTPSGGFPNGNVILPPKKVSAPTKPPPPLNGIQVPASPSGQCPPGGTKRANGWCFIPYGTPTTRRRLNKWAPEAVLTPPIATPVAAGGCAASVATAAWWLFGRG